MSRIALYTAVLGDSPDRPQGLAHGDSGSLYVDVPERWAADGGWKICRSVMGSKLPRAVGKSTSISKFTFDRSPRRRARWHKLSPFVFLPDAEFWMWVDGSHTPRYPLDSYLQYMNDSPICLFRHASRNCTYQEAEVCKRFKKDAAEVIDAQMREYRKRRLPYNAGLYETPVILSRNCAEVKDFFTKWRDELGLYSVRDQLSVVMSLIAADISPATFPGTAWDQSLFYWKNHWR